VRDHVLNRAERLAALLVPTPDEKLIHNLIRRLKRRWRNDPGLPDVRERRRQQGFDVWDHGAGVA
jgi:hypothetical protein